MQGYKKRLLTAFFATSCIMVLILVAGCGCPAPVYYSAEYTPVSEWEQREADKADRNIYPDDVRQDLNSYRDKTVVWPSLIKSVEVVQTPEGPDVIYLLEHHYYDWIEDHGAQREIVLLSPRGEGLFQTTWGLVKDTTEEEITAFADDTQLLIVYGEPISVEDGIIELDASYIRFIDKRWYTTEIFDYGRIGGD